MSPFKRHFYYPGEETKVSATLLFPAVFSLKILHRSSETLPEVFPRGRGLRAGGWEEVQKNNFILCLNLLEMSICLGWGMNLEVLC